MVYILSMMYIRAGYILWRWENLALPQNGYYTGKTTRLTYLYYLVILHNDGNLALYSSNKAWYNPSGVQAALETYGKCPSGKNL